MKRLISYRSPFSESVVIDEIYAQAGALVGAEKVLSRGADSSAFCIYAIKRNFCRFPVLFIE
jgi:hypothetical protein